MLANLNNIEKNMSSQNSQNLANPNSIGSKMSISQQEENNTQPKVKTQIIKEANTTSIIFNSLLNTSRLSNLITPNEQDNQMTNSDNKEVQNEVQSNNDVNKASKNSDNNDDNNVIVLDDDEEMEENEDENANDNINGNHENDNNNKKQKDSNQSDNNSNKNELNNKKKEPEENINLNGKNKTPNSNGTMQIEDKDKFINTEKQGPKKVERKLYYIRKITSNRRYKLRGTDKLNIQIFIGSLKPNDALPSFVFTGGKYYYYPHNCRQIIQNYKGYIISFPGIKKAFTDKIIKKDKEHLCTYYFKNPRRKQTSVDIRVMDEKTLNDGVFLNDGIVNFYLKVIEDEYTCGEDKTNNVLIMNSFFYNSIANQTNLNLSIGEFYYPESCSYTKTKINVFAYKTLIIPTCENYHWSLIIVNDIDKMKNIFSESNLKAYHEDDNYQGLGIADHSKEEGEGDYPEIFYLDSFYDISQRRMLIILKYLFYEYQKVYSVDVNMHNFLVKNYFKIECYNPDVPKQDNTYDCGIFLLMYAEMFLYNSAYFLQLISKKYKINKNNKIIQANNKDDIINNENNVNDKNIINNNIINNNDASINLDNINNNKNPNSNNNDNENTPSNNIKENEIIEHKIILQNNEIKKNETFINTVNKGNNDNNMNEENDKTEIDYDKIDIQIENVKYNENEEQNNKNNNSQNDSSHNGNNNLFGNNDLNNTEPDAEYNPIRNWFSYDLVNSQRTKIKKLINELSKMDKKKDFKEIMDEQNLIIKKYMEKQKEEFDEYFANLKD